VGTANEREGLVGPAKEWLIVRTVSEVISATKERGARQKKVKINTGGEEGYFLMRTCP
jgi:hypothetical protein